MSKGLWASAIAAAAMSCAPVADAQSITKTARDGAVGLAAPDTPPMGWNAWNTFRCKVDESLIRDTADAMIANGMRDVGYRYINLDDCWMGGRDRDGRLTTNARFASGIPALADYLHARGFKLGIYQSANSLTCAAIFDSKDISAKDAVGSLDHEAIDAATFAAWKVDYVKFDWCRGPADRVSFIRMRDALIAAGRPVFYSANLAQFPGTVGLDLPTIAHSARVSPDIKENWASIVSIIRAARTFEGWSVPGFWNDLDMLEVGRLATIEEDRTHFGLWAMLASPLLSGNDPRRQTASTLAILTNRDIIAISQDMLQLQAAVVREDRTGILTWARPLAKRGSRAVALTNLGDQPARINVQWSDLALAGRYAKVVDLWTGQRLGRRRDGISITVAPHGTSMLRVAGRELPRPAHKIDLVTRTPVYLLNGSASDEGAVGQNFKRSVEAIRRGRSIQLHAPAQLVYRLDRKCNLLGATVAARPEGSGAVALEIWGDGRLLTSSGDLTAGQSAKPIEARISGIELLRIIVRPLADGISRDDIMLEDTQLNCR